MKLKFKSFQDKKGSKNDFFSHEKYFKFLTSVLKKFGLQPIESSVAVAGGVKPSTTAVEIHPSIDFWLFYL